MLDIVRTRRLFCVATLLTAATVALAAYTAFPLVISFEDPLGPGLSGDGDVYVNRAEGKVPAVTMNRDGVIVLDTRGSTRTVCFGFDAPIVPGPSASLVPADVCAPVLLRTLIRPDNQRAADVPVGGSLDFGMDVYWTGPAQGGGSFQYVLEYKRIEGNGVSVTHPDADTWTVANILHARVSVYRKGKGGGWSVVGTYDLPVSFTAVRAN